MRFRAVFCCLIAAVLLTTVFTSTSCAQWHGHRQPGQRAFRYLGQGFGTGYHWQNPGPNSDYYNPYSAHNSLLISQQGPYVQQPMNANSYQQPGIPYSVYAPTNAGVGSDAIQSQPPGGDFLQAVPSSENDDNFFENDTRDDLESDLEDAVDDAAIYNPKTHSFQESNPKTQPNDFQPTGFQKSKRANLQPRSDSDWSMEDAFFGSSK